MVIGMLVHMVLLGSMPARKKMMYGIRMSDEYHHFWRE